MCLFIKNYLENSNRAKKRKSAYNLNLLKCIQLNK